MLQCSIVSSLLVHYGFVTSSNRPLMLMFLHFYYQEDESFEVKDLQMVVFD